MNASNAKTGGAYIKEVCGGTLIFVLIFSSNVVLSKKVLLDVKHGFNLKALNVNIPKLGVLLRLFTAFVIKNKG